MFILQRSELMPLGILKSRMIIALSLGCFVLHWVTFSLLVCFVIAFWTRFCIYTCVVYHKCSRELLEVDFIQRWSFSYACITIYSLAVLSPVLYAKVILCLSLPLTLV